MEVKIKINILIPILLLSLGFLMPRISNAAIINAASPAYEDVSAAVAQANYEDTVCIPAGEADWGNNTLNITKGINLIGAGTDKTIINSAPAAYSTSKYLIAFSADKTTAQNNYQFKLEGFYLKANGTYPPYALLLLANHNYANPLTKIIVRNNKFQQLSKISSSCIGIVHDLAVFGVIYNNEIVDGSHAWRFLGGLSNGKNVVYWEPGSPYAMYYEDNYIHISESWNTSQIIIN